MTNQHHPPPARPRRIGAAIGALVAFTALALAAGAPAQDLQSQLDAKRNQLDAAKQREGVLSSTIEKYSTQIDQLTGEVATLRNREAIVQDQLERTQARLDAARAHLQKLRAHLKRSLKVLRERLVAIYKADEPDALTVILNSDGFDDLLNRYQYLTSIEEQDTAIVTRVRTLRDQTKDTVETVRAARDEIAARKAELTRTRVELEAREADLSAARANKADALDQVQGQVHALEGDVSDLQGQIQAQIQAAQEAAAAEAAAAPPSGATPAAPAGPVQGESSSGFIWPVSGPVTSPFGMRWGRMHEGIDISVPEGTPVHAAASGRVIIAAYTGGYGNYTCIDHGGGLSTCYAHQSSFAVSSGQSVQQGQVIGYSGNTGSSTGPHLHFEVRVNGSAVDPMGYL
jgi:murein DD-endopeptidase MepM/ murein hydrolase activator NlpD